MNTIKPFLASSADPAKVSLTIESTAKVLSIAIGAFAVMKGMDATPLTASIKGLADQAIVLVSAGFATYHAGLTVYGLVRKMFVTKA